MYKKLKKGLQYTHHFTLFFHLLNLLIQHPKKLLLALQRVNTEREKEQNGKEGRQDGGGGGERKFEDVEGVGRESEGGKKYIMRIFHYTPPQRT